MSRLALWFMWAGIVVHVVAYFVAWLLLWQWLFPR